MPHTEPVGSDGVWTPPAVFDEYRVVRSLGRGAGGRVFLAHDTVLDRPVAIKFLVTSLGQGALERFLLEARAAARIQHANVAILYRVGQLGQRPYLVSEYVRGRALEDLSRPVPWRDAIPLIAGAARGLAAAHRRGVLHRDISPSNVVLAETGEVKLVDFGLARLDTAAVGSEPRSPGALVGTPIYAAPEIWRGEAATRRSDLYALAAVAYDLCTGRAPHAEHGPRALASARQALEVEPLEAEVPGIDPALSAAVARALRRDPAERFSSVDEFREALELGVRRPRHLEAAPDAPYRGLRAFGPEHRDVFFGRGRETVAVLERLRSSSVVVVAGDSGVGKSSLCAAAVVPAIVEGALEAGRTWSVARMVPGRRPIEALAGALSPIVGRTPEELAAELEGGPGELARSVRRALGDRGGLVLYVDQSEELVTVAEPAEAEACAMALAEVGAVGDAAKVLLTARSDFLTRLAGLPGLRTELALDLFLLAPLSREGLREAVVGPARARGYRFESEALVEDLVDTTAMAEGGLPLLQFALAELWEARDPDTATLTYRALQRIGGVEGALVRYGDGVLSRLSAEARKGARRALVRLVTLEGTRARRTEAELVRDEADREALEALVAARLVVAGEGDGHAVYELAHEALIRGWATLAGWLADSVEQRALEQRLATAAAEWERLGRVRDGLWGPRQLEDFEAVDDEALRDRERTFLLASREAVRRRRRLRWAAVLLVPVGVFLTWGGFTLRDDAAHGRRLAAALSRADQALGAAQRHAARADEIARAAYEAFDRLDGIRGEALWAEALAEREETGRLESEALQALEAALLLEPDAPGPRARFSDMLERRAERAEANGRLDIRDEALRRLTLYDDGGQARARFERPALLSVRTEVPASLRLFRVDREEGTWREHGSGPELRSPVEESPVRPGSYVLELAAPGRRTVRVPLLVRRGERVDVGVPLPPVEAVPDGFVFVPAGTFLAGSGHEALRRDFLNTVPLHPVATGAYLIGRTEVTYAEWFEFLDALPAAERRRRMPGVPAKGFHGGLRVSRSADGRYRIELQPAVVRHAAAEGAPIHYRDRDRRKLQDWRLFPVSGIRWDDMRAYTRWLDRTGKVPGARPCREDEWERAARGADGREYPSGSLLGYDAANIDLTYGKNPRTFGPDEVGSHPSGASPFGVHDMAGNVWELTEARVAGSGPVARGGSYYFSTSSARVANREVVEPTLRDLTVGFRVCADVTGAR